MCAEDVRVADADERDGLVAADRRALELDRRPARRASNDRALDARDPVVDRGVDRGRWCRACRPARAGGTGRRSRRACARRRSSGSRRRCRRAGTIVKPVVVDLGHARRRRAGRSCTGCRTRRSSPRARSGRARCRGRARCAATEAVSVARPASTRSAPAASAAVIGAAPISPTMCSQPRIDVLGERAGGLERGDRAGGERLEHGLARELAVDRRHREARPSSAAISRAMSATQSTPESVPEVPQLVTTTGMPAARPRRAASGGRS